MHPESFRDTIATVDKEGKRHWVFPKKPKGSLTTWRNRVSILLLALLFGGPYMKINGEPILLLNILERKFVLFGQVFWPQDFYIFGIIMITFFVFIVLFTVVFGRIWCGWLCPQTIFMENVFRKIEYWIEGDFKQQMALDKMPWNAEKIRKRSIKYVIFFFISFYISNTFLAYIIGIENLTTVIAEGPVKHLKGFTSILIFSGVFYLVFAWFREQACIIVCPYGRLQGVLLDKNSIVVAYDYKRGEERGLFKKNETRTKGDCIDCKACVNVCPTGIDIRNGTQLECVNCTACIDACNFMMESVNLKKGLIRYASESNIAAGEKTKFTTRIAAYSTVLTLLIGVCISLLIIRPEIDATILRTPGMMYQEQANGQVTNLYNYKVINKTKQNMPLEFRLLSHEGSVKLVGSEPVLKEDSISEGALFIELDKNQILSLKTKIKIGIYSGDKKLQEIKTTFLGPN
jgi:cytochrome c oxidase accessory protein FixG